MVKATKSLQTPFNARLLLAFAISAEAWQIEVLAPVLHCSAKGQKQWREDELARLIELAKARKRFLEFQRDDGGLIGADVSVSDLQLLQQTKVAILNNSGDIRNAAIKGAWAAYVSLLARKSAAEKQGKDCSNIARGNRYDEAFRNHSLA